MKFQSNAAGFNKSLPSAATKGCHRKFLCLEDRVVESGRGVVARNQPVFVRHLSLLLFCSRCPFSPPLPLPLFLTALNANNTIAEGSRLRQVRFFDRAHNSCPTAEGIQSRITELTLDSFDSTSDELLIGRIAAIVLSRDMMGRGMRVRGQLKQRGL